MARVCSGHVRKLSARHLTLRSRVRLAEACRYMPLTEGMARPRGACATGARRSLSGQIHHRAQGRVTGPKSPPGGRSGSARAAGAADPGGRLIMLFSPSVHLARILNSVRTLLKWF